MTDHPFNPDWTICPGETIKECMEHAGMSELELSLALKVALMDVVGLLNGKVAVSVEIAEGLHLLFGSPTAFWLQLEANHRADVVRLYKLPIKDEEE